MNRFPSHLARVGMFVAILLLAFSPRSSVGQVELCEGAEVFMAAEVGMAVVTEPEDVDDWRTDQVVPGCRVTAAGVTRRSLRGEAASFFERLRAAGWVRTPDPQDAPNESSLRFRKDGVDCLFSFYSGGLLGTEAEGRVDDARVPGLGQRRFNFLVQCMPAMNALQRSEEVPRGRGPGLAVQGAPLKATIGPKTTRRSRSASVERSADQRAVPRLRSAP